MITFTFNARNKPRRIPDPHLVLLRCFVLYVSVIVMVVRPTNCNTNKNIVFVSAFTAMKSQINHRELHNMHPSHFIRIQPCIIALHTLPQKLSITGTGQMTSCRSFRTDLPSRPVIQKPLTKKQQKGIEIISSTVLKNSAIPFATATAASTSSLVGVAFVSAISAGIFSGGLHAIAGPDHLAALLPRCIGQRWYRAVRVGAIWGIGHGLSATILGCLAFLIKRTVISSEYIFRSTNGSSNLFSTFGKHCLQFLASRGSNVMEIAVGLSLIVIGIMGIREARDFKFEYDEPVSPQSQTTHNLSAAVNVALTDTDNHLKSSTSNLPSLRTRAILLNGLLHGFSWDGAPSLAPALALMTWGHTITFLSSYAFGTMITMALVTTLIGEGTRQASQIFQRPDLPQKFSFASSILAISIGIVWCALGLM